MNSINVGIDLGGTKVSVGLVRNYRIINEPERFFISTYESADGIIGGMKSAIEKLLMSNSLVWDDVNKIGIGSPGPLDSITGVVLETPNLKIMRGYPIVKKFEEIVGIQPLLENDANCFTLGEQRAGVAKGMENVLGVTLGTGFGLGCVLNGRILRGATGTAMEFANSPYRGGVFEDYISGRGLAKIYLELTGMKIAPIEVSKRAKSGDVSALKVWEEFGIHLSNALIYLVNTLDPNMIVIGGSISEGFPFFYDPLNNNLLKGINQRPRENIKVVQSKLGEMAAIIGASSLE